MRELRFTTTQSFMPLQKFATTEEVCQGPQLLNLGGTLCSKVLVSLSGAHTSTSSVCPNPITSRVGLPSSLRSVALVVISATLGADGIVEVVLK